jgi:hypothetical protein
MPLSDEEIRDLKAKHGNELRAVESGDATLVFRKPKRQEYDHWFERREQTPQRAALEFAQQCLVSPDFASFMAALNDKPAILSSNGGVLDALLDMAGLGGATQKKL